MGTGSGLAALSLQAWLHGLGLTDAQRDKVFEIVHAQAPGLRQQAKAVRAARGELGALSTAATLDSAQLKAASDKLARALADMSESRVRTRNQIFQVLTPEQQKQVEAKLAQYDRKHGGHEGHMRPGGHHGHGHGMRPGHGPGRAPGAEATPAQQG
jgi:Spy/CpxP family protein refolding chaperone